MAAIIAMSAQICQSLGPGGNFTMQWLRFRQSEVRDLAWSLLSPNLLSSLPSSYLDEYRLYQPPHSIEPWLQATDSNPAQLLEHLSSRHSTRLGLYFESLWRYYLQQSRQLLAHNLQVNSRGRTLGEMDFLYRALESGHGELVHAEAAVKFYLGHPQSRESCSSKRTSKIASKIDSKQASEQVDWHAWIGPNAKDRLSMKMQHLLEHQLCLTKLDAAQAALSDFLDSDFLDSDDGKGIRLLPELILKGRLFYPYNESMPPPAFANPDHLKGVWCYQHQLEDFLGQYPLDKCDAEWVVLGRDQWFAEVIMDASELASLPSLFQDKQSLVEAIQSHKGPVIIARLKAVLRDNQSNLWQEQLRAFVMPDHWPN